MLSINVLKCYKVKPKPMNYLMGDLPDIRLWSRWQLEYLNELQMRQKWKANCQQLLKVGSLVLVKDDKAPPLQWPLGRVTSIHPGIDGIVRVVTVRVRGSETRRAVNRLCPLPVEC
nr:unnamed protein product [Callosobruchus chinensis]